MPPLPLDLFDLDAREVDRRFRWARAQGRPGFPWPDVAPERWRVCVGELTRATGEILADAPGPTVLDPAPTDGGVKVLSVAAYTTGLGPLLGRWLELGRLVASEEHRDVLALHLEHARLRARKVRETLDDAVGILSAGGFSVTVLKGAHTGAVYFPEPATRPSADVDLLVPPGALHSAGRALARAGYRPGPAQSRPGKADWIPAGAPSGPRSLHLVHADDPRSVELHDSLERDFFGVRRVTLPLPAQREILPEVHAVGAVLPPETLAAYLALHASQEVHHLQVLRLVELARVFRSERARGRLRPGAVADLLDQAGGLRFALPALDLTEKMLPGSVGPELLERARGDAPPRMLRYLAALRPANAQRLEGVAVDELFIWSRGLAETLHRAVDLLLPRRAPGSARPPGRTVHDRFSGILRGRLHLRTRSVRDEAAS